MVVLSLTLTMRQHIVEGVVTYALRQSFHPIALLLFAARGHSVNRVLTFHHFALTVSLARFNKVRTTARVKFEAVLLLSVRALPHRNILQRNNAPRLFVRCVFEIVQAVVVQDEPAPLPTLVPAALLPEPALLVRIEERVHQIVAIVFGDFERFGLDALVQTDEKLARKILPHIDASVHVDELLDCGLLFNAGVVQAGVEHYNGEGEDVAGVRVFEDVVLALTVAVALREALHHTVDFLGFAGEAKTP